MITIETLSPGGWAMTTFSELSVEELFPDSDGKPMADNTEQFR